MKRLLSLSVVGIMTAGLMLGIPSTSQAQSYGGYGPAQGGSVVPGYSNYNYNGYTNPAYGLNYGGYTNPGYGANYGGFAAQTYSPNYGIYGAPRVISHPTSIHWTPFQGVHTHGHIHVPHGFHSHVIRY